VEGCWTCSWWTSGTVFLMMGGLMPETCWVSYGIIKFWYTVGFFFVNCTMMHGSTNIKWCKYILICTKTHSH
jgi:hypothetical protein